jgi:predicted nucleotidyltransferase
MDRAELIKLILPVLEKAPEIRLAYLFGSQVSGNVGPLSDIDIAILFEEDTDIYRCLARIAHELAIALQTDRLDVIPLEHTPIELAHGIISHGVNVIHRDLYTRVEYEAKVMSMYGDYLPYLRAQREDIIRGDASERRIQRYRKALRRTERTLSEIKTLRE